MKIILTVLFSVFLSTSMAGLNIVYNYSGDLSSDKQFVYKIKVDFPENLENYEMGCEVSKNASDSEEWTPFFIAVGKTNGFYFSEVTLVESPDTDRSYSTNSISNSLESINTTLNLNDPFKSELISLTSDTMFKLAFSEPAETIEDDEGLTFEIVDVELSQSSSETAIKTEDGGEIKVSCFKFE